MNKIELFPIIRNAPLFTHLTDEQVAIIFEKLQLQTFSSHQIFIEQDDQTVEAYLITSGSVRVYRITENGDEVTLTFKGPGEVVGEMALLDEKPRSAYVATIQPTTVLAISRDNFRKIIFEYPEIAINLLKTLTKRLRETNQHLEEEVSQNLSNRTWNVLKALAPYFSNQEITMSQEELANIIGATRARVTEVLDQFQQDGKITLSHRKIHLN